MVARVRTWKAESMHDLTPEGLRLVEDVARRKGVSLDAAVTLLRALEQGNGSQAQFNHPELGGMGQWSQGGMIMIGDMFNSGLKYRVDSLCIELAALLKAQPLVAPPPNSQSQSQGGAGVSLFVPGAGTSGSLWPAELGAPNSTGAQNDLRYAWFSGTRRLAIQQGGKLSIYDTGDHLISGFSQQQGSDQSLSFNSQFGLVRVADLPMVLPRDEQPAEAPASAPQPAVANTPPPTPFDSSPPSAPPMASSDDIFTKIERLADLRQKGILTDEEFSAKKAELLSRI
jgi:hypothetical protein